MTEILADYREWRAEQEDRIGTHGDRCHMWPRHERCMIHRLARALEATRLTDEERQAVEWCVEMATVHATDCDEEIATLRGLLERTILTKSSHA